MIRRSVLSIMLVTLAAGTAYPVTIRHDVADGRYTGLAKKAELAAGLVITRPSEPVPGCGVIIHPNYILTAGHIGSVEGPADMPVEYAGRKYRVDRIFLFPAYKKAKNNWGGYDLAVLRLAGAGITGVKPAVIWMKGLEAGRRFIGVGQGRSGTGKQNDEPLPARTFRAYENTIDFIFGSGDYHLMAADFDSPDRNANSLADTLFHPAKKKIAGRSSAEPLPVEGSLAAGDSGSGIWSDFDGKTCLIGIATFRIYSCYAAQSYYVNLGSPEIAAWIRSVCPGAQCVRN